MSRPLRLAVLAAVLVLVTAACGNGSDSTPNATTTTTTAGDQMSDDAMMDATTFTVTIENVAAGSDGASPLSPGVFVVAPEGMPIFTAGAPDRGLGLEPLTEAGDPADLAASLQSDDMGYGVGIFDTPDGAASAGTAAPGHSYTFSFEAGHGDSLSFATMLVQSDDRFFAPGDGGIALFDGDVPVTGDVSDQVSLWDAGTASGSVVTQVGDGAGVVVTITAG
jgi:hypothetical protein